MIFTKSQTTGTSGFGKKKIVPIIPNLKFNYFFIYKLVHKEELITTEISR